MDKQGLFFLYSMILSGPILGSVVYLLSGSVNFFFYGVISGPFLVWVAFMTYEMVHE